LEKREIRDEAIFVGEHYRHFSATFCNVGLHKDREYVTDAGEKVDVYVSYHGKQTSEAHPHSPRICLPASGWFPSGSFQNSISLGDGTDVRVVEGHYIKGLDRRVFWYWYQTGTRYFTNEYLEKVYMIVDAMFRRRTDIAFIRLTTDVNEGGIVAAQKRLKDFVKVLVPQLNQILPG
jgi:EpsI family protein